MYIPVSPSLSGDDVLYRSTRFRPHHVISRWRLATHITTRLPADAPHTFASSFTSPLSSSFSRHMHEAIAHPSTIIAHIIHPSRSRLPGIFSKSHDGRRPAVNDPPTEQENLVTEGSSGVDKDDLSVLQEFPSVSTRRSGYG